MATQGKKINTEKTWNVTAWVGIPRKNRSYAYRSDIISARNKASAREKYLETHNDHGRVICVSVCK